MNATLCGALRRPRWLGVGLLLAASLVPASGSTAAAQQERLGSLTISPDLGPLGTKFHVHGTGFQVLLTAAHPMDLTVFDANTNRIDSGAVPANEDGTIDADIDTSDGSYSSGTYSILASYTYWGVVKEPGTERITCDFCPTKTVPLADDVTFTLE